MQDHVSRLVGLEGFEVLGVIEEGGRLLSTLRAGLA